MDTPIRTLIRLARTSRSLSDFATQVYVYGQWPLLRPVASAYRMSVARKVRLVAVVGSLGKTSTSRMLAMTLNGSIPAGIYLNAYANVAKAVLRVRPWQRFAVIEAGVSKPGAMRPYARMIKPDIVVVTSIASEHHRSFKTLQATREEKAEMVRELTDSGLVVLNGDDPNVMWMRGQTSARVVTYGFQEGCDIRATDFALDWPNGTRIQLTVDGKTCQAHTRLLGRVMVYPVLAAVAVGLSQGRDLSELLAAVQSVKPARGRLRPVKLSCGAFLLRDECKSTLETIHAGLDVLQNIPARRKFVILGGISEPPSPQGPAYRALGKRVASMAERAVFVGEKRIFKYYVPGAARAGMPREAMHSVPESPLEALGALPRDLGPGDVILVKGRDRQRLERISLALMGRSISCTVPDCTTRFSLRCEECDKAGQRRPER